tara:strand:+ start:519 stop:989 length:471 start_codon:yes stop_codon:yes gene_type:complete
MTIKAKPVLKDRFWIVEQDNQKIGTMSLNDDRYMFSSQSETCFFDNQNQIKKKFGVIVWDGDISINDHLTNDFSVNGFPTSVHPYNMLYDVKRKLPLFTKSNKSKSTYCAGYYIIKFDKGWVKSFCPKLITVERYEFKGPLKTELEMRQVLSIANR